VEYLVDILMPVYNHEKFIGQALQGVVEQKADFKFRLLIGEDCSTDGTRMIIEQYQKKFPSVIFPFFREENLGPYKNSGLLFDEIRSKYVALCEGDDFWTDPLKLQRQVDFLEGHPEYAICAHAVYEFLEDKKTLNCLSEQPRTYTIEDLAELGNFIPTVSTVYRNPYEKMPEWFITCPVGDFPLHMLNAARGKIFYLPEPMAVYRKFTGIHGPKPLAKRYIPWYKTLDILVGRFNDAKIDMLLRRQQARCIVYWYENDAEDLVVEHAPLAKEVLDMAVARTTLQMARFKTKFLLLSIVKKLSLSVRHNTLVNKFSKTKNK
jgi:glycosyltransferase involved in cell wall biosynthesis